MQAQIDELKQHIEQCNILLSNMVEQEFKQARAVDKLKQDFDKLNQKFDVHKYILNPYRKNGPWPAPWV